MSDVTIYHNPRCSKSRQALELLIERGLEVEIVEYLRAPLDVESLRMLHAKLRINTHEMVRAKEEDYEASGLHADATDEEVFNAISRYPKLLERPIIVRGEKAVIARPPERMNDLV